MFTYRLYIFYSILLMLLLVKFGFIYLIQMEFGAAVAAFLFPSSLKLVSKCAVWKGAYISSKVCIIPFPKSYPIYLSDFEEDINQWKFNWFSLFSYFFFQTHGINQVAGSNPYNWCILEFHSQNSLVGYFEFFADNEKEAAINTMWNNDLFGFELQKNFRFCLKWINAHEIDE